MWDGAKRGEEYPLRGPPPFPWSVAHRRPGKEAAQLLMLAGGGGKVPDNALETEYNSNCLLLPPLLFFGSFETIFSPPLSTSSIVPLIPLSPFFRAYLAHSTHCTVHTVEEAGKLNLPRTSSCHHVCAWWVWCGLVHFACFFSPRPHSSSAIPFSGRDPKGGKWWISGGGRGGGERRGRRKLSVPPDRSLFPMLFLPLPSLTIARRRGAK